jgi:hypothetical protein
VSNGGTNSLGRYHFLAWARQGVVATLTNPDYGGSLPPRGAMQAGLTVTAGGASPASAQIPAVSVQTFGPGDVIGLDPRHVVRTEPRDSTTNFEPNYLAGIEFDTPDFPWLFTPAAPAGDRLRPWVVLVVLKVSEYNLVPGAPQPLPAVDVTATGALPSLEDSWNWAHVQVSGDGGLVATLTSQPAAVISRLLCPRRLDPETAYTAFAVPAFEIGRQAGLGADVSALTSADPAWTTGTTAPLRLPFYYRFDFHTSDQGDFESLVRRLTPTKLGPGIGQRPLGVDSAAPDFPSAGPPLGLPGALQSLATQPTPWPDPGKTNFQTAMQGLVNRIQPVVDNPEAPDPEVVPPIYGAWQAGVLSVSATGLTWLDELNLDPRYRTMGGMGTQVVQSELTSLMASAWQQVAGIEQANALLKRAQLARATLTMVHGQLATASSTTVLTTTAPLHARLLASPVTVLAAIAASRVPVRLLSPTARRLTSAGGAIRRRQKSSGASIGSVVEGVNANRFAVVPPPAPPGAMVSIESLSDRMAPVWAQWFPIILRATVRDVSVRVTIDVEGTKAPLGIAALTPQAIAQVPPNPTFSITSPPATPDAAGATTPGAAATPAATEGSEASPGTGSAAAAGSAGTADSAEAARFRQAMLPVAGAWQSPAPDPPLAPALSIDEISQGIVTKLDPAVTVAARIASQLHIGPGLNWDPPDPVRTIMAAPALPQPMYEPLRDLSPQYIMPGVNDVPADSVGLVESNHAFIEAYMVGLSYEMARQLLWAGYPTDCMGTYFRQFWDVSKYVPQATDPTDPAQLSELLKDIPPITKWPLPGALGTHENRTGIPADNVVLLIRGELLRRYPDAVIYAAKAKLSGDQRVIDETDERYPIFSGSLPGDITFIGFNLSPADAKGGTPSSPEGFFFVFQQHPSGPRFGLEPTAASTVTQWSDLAWTNFAVPQTTTSERAAPSSAGGAAPLVELPAYLPPWAPWRLASSVFGTVLGSTALPDFLTSELVPTGVAIAGTDDTANSWGADAAQTAYITLRLPFRIAVHADLMVPS